MNYVILNEILDNTGSNEEGLVLFEQLKNAYNNDSVVTLCVAPTDSLSPSFLNTSVGLFLEKYGLGNFKKTVRFKGNKNQYNRLKRYIQIFSELDRAMD